MITSMAFQRNPDPILWCTLSDGTLISMTYEREQNVIAWSRHILGLGIPGQTTIVTPESTDPSNYPTLRPATAQDDPLLPHTTPISTWDEFEAIFSPNNIVAITNSGVSNRILVETSSAHGFTIDSGWVNIAFSKNYSGAWWVDAVPSTTTVRLQKTWIEDESSGYIYDGSGHITGNYYLTADLDASKTSGASYRNWNTIVGSAIGWWPLTVVGTPKFQGTLDGCGYSITGLYQNQPAQGSLYTYKLPGLLGTLGGGAKIANLTVSGADITGTYGGVMATGHGQYDGGASFYNCHTSGTFVLTSTGTIINTVGGFIGLAFGASNSKVYFYDCTSDVDISSLYSATVTTINNIGGFAAASDAYTYFYNCSASGNVSATGFDVEASWVGGFAGFGSDVACVFYDCHATGNVSGGDYVGGFIGGMGGNTDIQRCYATGNVTGTHRVGGFIGNNSGQSTVNCYARGNVTGTQYVGGFIGYGFSSYQTNNYSTGLVTGLSDIGGFIGYYSNYAICNTSYWDKETSDSENGVLIMYSGNDYSPNRKTTTEMKTKSTYIGWDFDTVWEMIAIIIPATTRIGPQTQSVAVIPGSAEDEVWLIVSRVIGGQLVRYLEQMQPRDSGDDQEDCWFVDSGLSLEGSDVDGIVTGLGHLEGEQVAILVDGAVVPRQTVTNGQVNVGCPIARKAIVGLGFRYKLKPMRFDLDIGGTTQGTIKRFAEIVISFYRSGGVKYGIDEAHLFDIDFRTTESYGSPPALYTGDKPVTHEGGFSVEDEFIITGDDPLPCTVRAIIARIEITGR